jgi:hypothetical protein
MTEKVLELHELEQLFNRFRDDDPSVTPQDQRNLLFTMSKSAMEDLGVLSTQFLPKSRTTGNARGPKPGSMQLTEEDLFGP